MLKYMYFFSKIKYVLYVWNITAYRILHYCVPDITAYCTARRGGLHAGICHIFLVLQNVAVDRQSIMKVRLT